MSVKEPMSDDVRLRIPQDPDVVAILGWIEAAPDLRQQYERASSFHQYAMGRSYLSGWANFVSTLRAAAGRARAQLTGSINLLDTFETEKFPEESCVLPNTLEKGIRDSAEIYLCVVVDKRWPTQCRLEHLHPYTAKAEKLLFGWSRIDFDGYIDHIEDPIHLDHERVIAWKKVEVPENFWPKVAL